MMASAHRIQFADRTFVPYKREGSLKAACTNTALSLNVLLQKQPEPPIIVPVLTGAYRFASEVIGQLRHPYEIQFVKLASYLTGLKPDQSPDLELDIQQDITGRHLIILEDIVDTGATLDTLIQHFTAKGATQITCATLFFKEEAFHGMRRPDYIGMSIPDIFVVGFGLDYQQQGRWLNDLYQVELS